MTEVLDLHEQDSDGGSEEVVLTPAELIERLEQVSPTPVIEPLCPFLVLNLLQVCSTGAQEIRTPKVYF